MDSLIHDNVACLEHGISLLRSLSPEQFTRRSPRCFNSTIGGHLRHNTDHYESFLSGWSQGVVDYDHRRRDYLVESDPHTALRLLEDLRTQLLELPASALDQEIRIKMDSGAADHWSQSSVRRELQFLLSHTIHHFALIVAIGSDAHVTEFPPGFGVAPSTIKYRRQTA